MVYLGVTLFIIGTCASVFGLVLAIMDWRSRQRKRRQAPSNMSRAAIRERSRKRIRLRLDKQIKSAVIEDFDPDHGGARR